MNNVIYQEQPVLPFGTIDNESQNVETSPHLRNNLVGFYNSLQEKGKIKFLNARQLCESSESLN